MAIYRVIVRKTNSVQPVSTFWNKEVLYCGSDLEEARITFLKSEATDEWCGYGSRATETIIEEFDCDPDDISSVESKNVEV